RVDTDDRLAGYRIDVDRHLGAVLAVARARPEALRVRVVGHRIGRDVPGQVSAAAEPAVVCRVRFGGEVGADARAVRDTGAASARRILRAVHVLGVFVPAGTAGQRQDLRNQIEVGRYVECRLLVAAPEVLTERR